MNFAFIKEMEADITSSWCGLMHVAWFMTAFANERCSLIMAIIQQNMISLYFHRYLPRFLYCIHHCDVMVLYMLLFF